MRLDREEWEPRCITASGNILASGKMEKINFHKPGNQFPRAGIRLLLKKTLLPPSFKDFNKSLNKGILFSLDRKYVSTSRNEELVKKYVST